MGQFCSYISFTICFDLLLGDEFCLVEGECFPLSRVDDELGRDGGESESDSSSFESLLDMMSHFRKESFFLFPI